ncbi:hypothetical protein [Vulcanococcus limneticus]|uniref:hypothetical protein n=1 Tax=Vulcanococcus limneticus TaxID=2170428 RepID=UPI00398BCBA3
MTSAPAAVTDRLGAVHRYPMAPLIRFTLIGLYLALVLPLPALAPPELRAGLGLALPLGLLLVVAATSEQVSVDDTALAVGHPRWCAWLLRRGWRLEWHEIGGLTPVATSQGGRVWYVRRATAAGGTTPAQAYLLPQRVQHLEALLAQFQMHTGLDTSAIGRISPPWTYQLLAGLTALMLAAELLAGAALARGVWAIPAAMAAG